MALFLITRNDDGHTEHAHGEELLDACERISEAKTRKLTVTEVADKPPAPPSDPVIAAAIVVGLTNGSTEPKVMTGAFVGDASPAKVNSSFGGQLVVDDEAKTRIEAQHAALTAAGVAVDTGEQFFATGTRMADVGYATQAARKAEHQAKMRLAVAAARLIDVVKAERRENVELTAGQLGSSIAANGKVTALGGLALTEQAIRGLSSRLESPMLGYVLGIRVRISRAAFAVRGLRADIEKGESRDAAADRRTIDGLLDGMTRDRKIIASVLVAECRRSPDVTLKLRTRAANSDIFAVTSPAYTSADAPEVVGELVDGLPADARGSWSYDPATTSWELRAHIWTPTPVAEQAVGEPFEGYASFQSRDNGTSRFRGGGGVTLLRCLNASTYVAEGTEAARIHRSGIKNLEKMVAVAREAIDALCLAWGDSFATPLEVPSGVSVEDAIPGFWRYCLTARRSELAGVLPGRSDEHVRGLTTAFHEERRVKDQLVRSDLAQGWTRYIQGQPTSVRREAEIAVGEWLHSGSKVSCDLRA